MVALRKSAIVVVVVALGYLIVALQARATEINAAADAAAGPPAPVRVLA